MQLISGSTEQRLLKSGRMKPQHRKAHACTWCDSVSSALHHVGVWWQGGKRGHGQWESSGAHALLAGARLAQASAK